MRCFDALWFVQCALCIPCLVINYVQTSIMHFDHLYNASMIIKTHVTFATAGVIVGALQLFGKKGGQRHKILGWTWVIIMSVVGLSALFLPKREQGILPLTFLLTVWVAIGLPLGIRAIKKGNILLHRAFMIGLYVGGLFIALAFTVTPGRLLYKVIFGP